MAKLVRANLPTLKKTASYYVVHVTVAAGVAYAVTGNLLLSLTLSLLEPAVQAVAFFFHEKAWQRWDGRTTAKRAAGRQRLNRRDQPRCGSHVGYCRKSRPSPLIARHAADNGGQRPSTAATGAPGG